MPGNRRLRPVSDTDLEEVSVYNDMSDEEVTCRAGTHKWALDSVLPGEAWPDVVRAWPGTLGVYRIEDPCLVCDLVVRVMDTLPGGEMDPDFQFSYVYARNWVSVPMHLKRGKRRSRQEKFRRIGKKAPVQVKAAARRTAASERATPPPARFSGVS